MRRILLALAVAALMAVMAAGSAAAQEGPPDQAQGPPVGGCPANHQLVTVEFLISHTDPPLTEPDPSMDPNGDGLTCIKLLPTGQGTRVTWHDNVIPQ
jgi:hypothetical protein